MSQKNPNPNQLMRPRPRGPDQVICAVIEKGTGRTVIEAVGRVTSKYSAESRARQNALWSLKKKLGHRFAPDEYFLAYRT